MTLTEHEEALERVKICLQRMASLTAFKVGDINAPMIQAFELAMKDIQNLRVDIRMLYENIGRHRHTL